MTYLAKYDFFYFSQSLESCSSVSREAIINFSKYLESPVHALFTIYYDKFSLNQVFRSKKPCGFAFRADFAGFCVCHTDLGGGGGGSSYSSFPPTPGPTHPPTLIHICTTHLSRQWEDLPTDLRAIQPTCREVKDFKKAVSQRVKVISFKSPWYGHMTPNINFFLTVSLICIGL
jgi:hypothetical protein